MRRRFPPLFAAGGRGWRLRFPPLFAAAPFQDAAAPESGCSSTLSTRAAVALPRPLPHLLALGRSPPADLPLPRHHLAPNSGLLLSPRRSSSCFAPDLAMKQPRHVTFHSQLRSMSLLSSCCLICSSVGSIAPRDVRELREKQQEE